MPEHEKMKQHRRTSTKTEALWKCRDYGNRGKPNCGFPRFPQPLEIADAAIPTFPQREQLFPCPTGTIARAPRALAMKTETKARTKGVDSPQISTMERLRFQAHPPLE
jgi:hypothetical protein